jgi:hypothetical protein
VVLRRSDDVDGDPGVPVTRAGTDKKVKRACLRTSQSTYRPKNHQNFVRTSSSTLRWIVDVRTHLHQQIHQNSSVSSYRHPEPTVRTSYHFLENNSKSCLCHFIYQDTKLLQQRQQEHNELDVAGSNNTVITSTFGAEDESMDLICSSNEEEKAVLTGNRFNKNYIVTMDEHLRSLENAKSRNTGEQQADTWMARVL